jgi:hypothetical protein
MAYDAVRYGLQGLIFIITLPWLSAAIQLLAVVCVAFCCSAADKDGSCC